MSRHAESSRPRPRAGGFTLIEVLAALVIVALGMLGVIQAVTQTARNGTYLREKTLAHWIGMNLITERRLLASPPDVAESSDELEFAGQRWRWTLRVTQTPVASLRRMDVSVRAADAPETSSLATVTGFYGTAIGASGGGTVAWGGEADGGGPGGDGDDDGDDGDGSPDGGKPGVPGSGDEPPPDAGDPGDEEPPSTD
ncbi:MAG: type II secretion system protein GspI [Lysobacterales bacterium]|nr:MAG: type II secretion system protein GspI [Xanthomonadales bacterium]